VQPKVAQPPLLSGAGDRRLWRQEGHRGLQWRVPARPCCPGSGDTRELPQLPLGPRAGPSPPSWGVSPGDAHSRPQLCPQPFAPASPLPLPPSPPFPWVRFPLEPWLFPSPGTGWVGSGLCAADAPQITSAWRVLLRSELRVRAQHPRRPRAGLEKPGRSLPI